MAARILVIFCISFLVATFFMTSEGRLFAHYDNFEPREVQLEGRVAGTPDARRIKTFFILNADDMDEHIRVSTSEAGIQYGQRVTVSGELQRPENFAEFSWRAYLAKKGVGYEMHEATVRTESGPRKDVGYFAAVTRQKLSANIQSVLLPPHSALYRAMVLGEKDGIGDSRRTMLAGAGLSHIAAISGLHIAVLGVGLAYLLIYAGLWRRQALLVALAVLGFYILMIGAPASAVRAGIMAAVVVLAELVGRPRSPWRPLLLAAAVMVAFNPLVLRYDVGFQLSFAAVAGILFLANPLDRLIGRVRLWLRQLGKPKQNKEVPSNAAQKLFTVSGAAQFATAPLTLLHFGQASVWAPLSNLLIIPVLPGVLGAGIVSSIGGFFGATIGTVAAAPAWILSEYVWFIAGVFG